MQQSIILSTHLYFFISVTSKARTFLLFFMFTVTWILRSIYFLNPIYQTSAENSIGYPDFCTIYCNYNIIIIIINITLLTLTFNLLLILLQI